MYIQQILLFFFLTTQTLYAAEDIHQTLGSRFQKAEAGDFVVVEQGKLMTLFHVMETHNNEIFIEEITAPLTKIASWQEWLNEEAPHYSSWTQTRVDLTTGKLISLFSRSHGEWIQSDALFSFLPTLLQLKFIKVPLDERKKVGPAPIAGEEERRKLWLPKIFVNGKEVPNDCDVFQVKWPKDGSELSEKTLSLYLPKQEGKGLSYFPYWIEIAGKLGKVKLRVIDSGKGLLFQANSVNTSVMNRENSPQN
ncbi:MAG: hypothetical protein JWO53_819 [Chlamydiia bacterium]|nr:hypothetical protein [Chlamydiia bacterium]